jgi:hypothetical protein
MTDDAYQLERSPDARRRAETALVRLTYAHEAELPRLVLLGGLVPQILAIPTAPAHLGTADVDLLVVLHVSDRTDASTLEHALDRAGFTPDSKTGGWRWRAVIDGVGVKVEFLCDDESLRDQDGGRAGEVLLPGCTRLSAANLDGTRFVAFDTRRAQITGPLVDGTVVTVEIEHACLEGYLLTKLHAARYRGDDKDYYDFVYTLLANEGGPSGAADAVVRWDHTPASGSLATLLAELEARFATDEAAGTRAYASQSRLADPETNVATARLDAQAAIAEFVDVLRASGRK